MKSKLSEKTYKLLRAFGWTASSFSVFQHFTLIGRSSNIVTYYQLT